MSVLRVPAEPSAEPEPASYGLLDVTHSPAAVIGFCVLLLVAVAYAGYGLVTDVRASATEITSWLPMLLLVLALLIALGFEFVNGFHDTANAVATVIYTHSLPPLVAVVWSGIFNFLGVMLSTGAVAFGIIALLPLELVLNVDAGSGGLIMVFAMLISAIAWNLGTWWLGLPASSSHTLIGSILGVGIANALMSGRGVLSGVDWSQAVKAGYALLFSPLVGFVAAALLLLALRVLVRNRALYEAPRGNTPPPMWIRALLVLTCTGVSFAHGSNDGQKGMGLIMLILVGTLPLAYALDRTVSEADTPRLVAIAMAAQQSMTAEGVGLHPPQGEHPRTVLTRYVQNRSQRNVQPEELAALLAMMDQVRTQVEQYGSVAGVPPAQVLQIRNDMYLTSEAIRLMEKHLPAAFDGQARGQLKAFRKEIDRTTKFIPLWVKLAVAIALGLGTLVGWKRVVRTVGEKIGKERMTYAQGVSAQFVAMTTIGAADVFGLPVSTTHVLSSGVAGTMAANRSGLHGTTIRNMLLAWVLTLPAAMLLSGVLYWLLHWIF